MCSRLLSGWLAVLMVVLSSVWVQADGVCSVGDQAEVEWKGKWYPATVTRVNESQTRCFIRYKGYGSEWDEWVGEERIRIASRATPAGRGGWSVGDAVQVSWQGKWYPASIIARKSNLFKIHYDGYAASWDEWVESGRIRNR